MAKIKKITDGKLAGKPASSPTGAKANSNEVIAVRNGVEQTFTRQIWDHLPPGKDGYEEVSEAPAAAKTSKHAGTQTETADKGKEPAAAKTLTAKEQKDAYTAAAAEYQTVFGEAPGQDLSTDDINAKIAEEALKGGGE